MIREGKTKEERFIILKEIADYQIRILNEAQNISNEIDREERKYINNEKNISVRIN